MAKVLDSKIPAGPVPEKWKEYKAHQRLVNPKNKLKLDVIVVGTGLAGASAAASLGEMGFNVINLCIQDSPRRAHSIAAQGSIFQKLHTFVIKKSIKYMRQIKRLLFLLLLLSMVDDPCFAHIFTNDSIPDAIPPDSVFNTMAMRRFVVVNLESNAPVRDILVYTDDGQEAKTKWDGTFALHETFKRIDFVHPNYEKRYMLREEIKSDTIALIPNLYALNEVVIYGHRRNSNLMNSVKLSKVDAHLLQSQPTGFNILGLMAWGLDEIWLKKARHRKEMKKQKQKMILENY